MGVDANAGSDREVTRGALAVEIFILDAAERNATDVAFHRDFSGRTRTQRNSEIVCQGVCGAKGKNGQRDWRTGQSLNDIVNGAIAATGKNGIASGSHGTAGVIGRFLARAANRKLGTNAG